MRVRYSLYVLLTLCALFWAGLFIHVITVFTVLMGVTLLGEEFRLFHLAGISLIITGVYLAVVVPAREPC